MRAKEVFKSVAVGISVWAMIVGAACAGLVGISIAVKLAKWITGSCP